MRRKITVAVLVLLIVALYGFATWQWVRKPEPVGRFRARVEHAVLDYDLQADSELKLAVNAADSSTKAEIEKEFVRCAIQALKNRDNLYWKPYTFVRTNAPTFVSGRMPQWREPRKTRRAAAWWLLNRAVPWKPEPAAPGLNEQAAPILCSLAKSDRGPEVRQAATWALGAMGSYSEDAFQIMLGALNHSEPADRRAACRWFGRNKLAAERVVPVLLRGLEDNAMRSDYAEALRAYGSQARFVLEPLIALAKTNDSATASVASWALAGVDPVAARKAGVNW